MAYVRIKKAWDKIPESQVTPESRFTNRRDFLQRLGFTGMGLTALLGTGSLQAEKTTDGSVGPYGNVPEYWATKWSDLFPAVRNNKFKVDRSITDESLFGGYNNFYEFTIVKQEVKDLVKDFKTHPWEVDIRGEIEKKRKYDVDELIRMGQLEERIYHFRCVEAWSANTIWTGYPLSQLIKKLNPNSKANYVRFVTAYQPKAMPGIKSQPHYPWPYYEALTMEEAMNELALLCFGIYGHPLSKQTGAPVRLIVPWKFGFKNIKSIVKIEFVERQPGTLWSDVSHEYGFWANINPQYDHPRWSQASERFINTGERIPTQIYNGYGEYVAHLYDEDDRKYFF